MGAVQLKSSTLSQLSAKSILNSSICHQFKMMRLLMPPPPPPRKLKPRRQRKLQPRLLLKKRKKRRQQKNKVFIPNLVINVNTQINKSYPKDGVFTGFLIYSAIQSY